MGWPRSGRSEMRSPGSAADASDGRSRQRVPSQPFRACLQFASPQRLGSRAGSGWRSVTPFRQHHGERLALQAGGYPGVAREAITALGMIGPAAKEAIPRLEELAGGYSNPQISERAKAALRQVRGR